MSFRAERGISPLRLRKGVRGMHHGNHGSTPCNSSVYQGVDGFHDC